VAIKVFLVLWLIGFLYLFSRMTFFNFEKAVFVAKSLESAPFNTLIANIYVGEGQARIKRGGETDKG